MPETKRLFIALTPPAPIKAALARVRDEAFSDLGGKPVSDANLHLTLAFPGSIPAARVDELAMLIDALAFEPLDLRLDLLGSFTDAKVVWLGMSQRHARLDALVAQLWSALNARGFLLEVREFNAHVTLLRKAVCDAMPTADLPWMADEIGLFESVSGQPYRILHSRKAVKNFQ